MQHWSQRHHVEMTVEVQQRTRGSSSQPADDVHAWMLRGVLGAAVGGHLLDVVIEFAQPLAEPVGAGRIVIAGRIHGGDGDQFSQKRRHLAGHRLHALQHGFFAARS
jgi:hypothetical protein